MLKFAGSGIQVVADIQRTSTVDDILELSPWNVFAIDVVIS